MKTIQDMRIEADRMFEIHEMILDHMTFHKMSQKRKVEWDLTQANIYDRACDLQDTAKDYEDAILESL